MRRHSSQVSILNGFLSLVRADSLTVADFVAVEAPEFQLDSIELKQQTKTGSTSISWESRNSTDFNNRQDSGSGPEGRSSNPLSPTNKSQTFH
jgi:hypothetical protein